MHKTAFFIFFTFCLNPIFAQHLFKGKVLDPEGIPIIMANVIAFDKDALNILSYTRTNADGTYSLSLKNNEIVSIEISMIGYEKKRFLQKASDSSINVILNYSSINLQEVKITSTVLRDTVELKTDNLSQQASLRDILQKNTGIEVEKNGSIMVDGKPVNKILINKKEVFVNQNNLALDHITKEIIKDIKVINNYNDKFNIDFDNRKSTVININTKEAFKGVMKYDLEGNYGYKNKFALNGKSMLFSDQLNLFITQQSNNVLEHHFNVSETAAIYDNLTSSIFNQALSLFNSSQSSVNRDFSNTSSLTLKKEFDKLRISAIVYYNRLNQQFNTDIIKEGLTSIINKEENQNKQRANFIELDFSLNYFPSSNSIILYTVHSGYINQKTDKSLTQSNFYPKEETSIGADTLSSKPFVLANNLSFKKLLNNNLLWTNNAFAMQEISNKALYSVFEDNSIKQAVNQNLKFQNTQLNFSSSLDYRIKNLVNFISGIEYTYSTEDLSIKTFNANTKQWDTQRHSHQFYLPITFRGDNKKFNYILKLSPGFYVLEVAQKSKNTVILPLSSSVYYKFNSKNSLSLFGELNYNNHELLQTVDTTFINFNTRILSDPSYSLMLNRQINFGLRYGYNNISKTQAFSITLGYNHDKNKLQNFFSEFDQDKIYYKIMRLAYQKNSFAAISIHKGFYFSKALHKIVFKSALRIGDIRSAALINNTWKPLNDTDKRLLFGISFEPQNMFFTELKLSYLWNANRTFLDGSDFNKQKSHTASVGIVGEYKSLNYELGYYNKLLSIGARKFIRNDIDFKARYKITKNLNLLLQSGSLLTLTKLSKNDFSGIDISSQEGIKTTTISPDILGYFVTGLQVKF